MENCGIEINIMSGVRKFHEVKQNEISCHPSANNLKNLSYQCFIR